MGLSYNLSRSITNSIPSQLALRPKLYSMHPESFSIPAVRSTTECPVDCTCSHHLRGCGTFEDRQTSFLPEVIRSDLRILPSPFFSSNSFLPTCVSNFANMGILSGLLLSSLVIVHGLPSHPGSSPIPTPSKSIEWGSCPGNYTPPFHCAKFLVPLDYSDKTSIDLLELSLIKLNATKEPSKGSILFNPGGPGGSGVELIVKAGAELSPWDSRYSLDILLIFIALWAVNMTLLDLIQGMIPQFTDTSPWNDSVGTCAA